MYVYAYTIKKTPRNLVEAADLLEAFFPAHALQGAGLAHDLLLLAQHEGQRAGADGPVNPGDIGIAASTLRPAGKASFGELFLDVVSDGGYIDHGTEIEVIRVAGNRIVVRPKDEELSA